MHRQRSAAERVDVTGEASTRPPPPLRGPPSSREEGKPDHPARCAGTPPQERRFNPTTPPAARAPLLKRGGEIRPPNHESPSAAFCLAISSAIPCFASASSTAICAAEKGAPSAVPCTSTKQPEPVITTFMSVSQLESSA